MTSPGSRHVLQDKFIFSIYWYKQTMYELPMHNLIYLNKCEYLLSSTESGLGYPLAERHKFIERDT